MAKSLGEKDAKTAKTAKKSLDTKDTKDTKETQTRIEPPIAVKAGRPRHGSRGSRALIAGLTPRVRTDERIVVQRAEKMLRLRKRSI